MASSRLVMIAGRLSHLLTRNLLTTLAVSEFSPNLKRVLMMMRATSSSVCWSDSARKMKPLRVVANEEGGGMKGMNSIVDSFVEMKHW